jgi:regulator of G-protein signaling
MYHDTKLLHDRRQIVLTPYNLVVGEATINAVFDYQQDETTARTMNILLTLFVVLIFVVGSVVFTNDAKVMIIQPIERLTTLIKKLAGMVFILSADESGGSSPSGANDLDFIDAIALKMSSVFEVDSTTKKAANKATQNVLPQEIDGKNQVGKFGGAAKIAPNNDDSQEEREKLIASRSELHSLRDCLGNEKSRNYFRLFLSREFNVENISFWEAAHEYKTAFLKKSNHIYSTFISQAAISQVNIPASQRAVLKKMLVNDDPVCDSKMFDNAQDEIFKLMSRDPFPRFLKSDLASTFCRIANNDDLVASQPHGSASHGRVSMLHPMGGAKGEHVTPKDAAHSHKA